jgi:alpha-amylase
MNVLSDFKLRLNTFVPESEMEVQLAVLNKALYEKDEKIKKYEAEIARLQPRIVEKITTTAKQKTTSTRTKSKK